MQCLTSKYRLFIFLMIGTLSISSLGAESLYQCDFNGELTTYHENDAKRMLLLGADCRIMNESEHITCSMKGVRINYSRSEAEELLYSYPDAHCEMNDKLFVSSYQQSKISKPLNLVNKIIIYFPISGTKLSAKEIAKISRFSKQHRKMGYRYNITGYASATGKSSANYLLSLKRAGSVRNALLNGGINSNNILSVDALGEESLRYSTKYEMSSNRAVIVKVFGK